MSALSAEPSPSPAPATESPPVTWSLQRRIAFRFGIIVAAILVYPFPLSLIPKLEWLGEALGKPLEWITLWCATSVLGLEEPSIQPTGSGDTLFAYVMHFWIAIVAIIGTIAWSWFDRRRLAYPRLERAAIVVLRYYLGTTLLIYAFAKLSQFPPPHAGRLETRVGEMSPMGILWTFMGSSQPYSLFGGFAEALGGVLLLFRRTSIAGALASGATLTNVVMLNLCYDVPVKLFSMQLLLISGVIVLPQARRLLRAVLGYAAPEVPPRTRGSRRSERARLAAKLVFFLLLILSLGFQVHESLTRFPPPHGLEGSWTVQKFVLDGTERPPLATDAERWHRLSISPFGGSVRLMTEERVRFGTKLDPAARTIEIALEQKETWTYAKTEGDEKATLIVDGTFRGKKIHVELVRDPAPLLVTRGFHWINEIPFNR